MIAGLAVRPALSYRTQWCDDGVEITWALLCLYCLFISGYLLSKRTLQVVELDSMEQIWEQVIEYKYE